MKIASIFILLLLTSAPAEARMASRCRPDTAIKFARGLNQLPEYVRNDLETGGRIADIGQPYFSYHSLNAHSDNRSLSIAMSRPLRRLVEAGRSGNRWFVWVEANIPTLYDEVFGYHLEDQKWQKTASLRGDPCAAINAIARGVQNSFDTLPHPLTYKDRNSNILFFVDRDGQHVTAIRKDGHILWDAYPFADAHLDPYRINHPIIVNIGPAMESSRLISSTSIGIKYSSSQFGRLRIADGKFTFDGQN